MTYSFSLITLLCTVIISAFISLSTFIVCAAKVSPRKFLITLCLHFLWSIIVIGIGNADSPYKLALTIFAMTGQCFIIGFRGLQLLLKTFISILCSFGGDICGGIIMLTFFESGAIEQARAMNGPFALLLQIVVGGSMLFCALLYRGISRLFRIHIHRHKAGYLLRPLLLLLVNAALFGRAISHLSEGDQAERLQQVLPDFVIIIFLLCIGITYIIQDIRFYRQIKENQLLTQQQSLQALLLKDTRTFRHNIANMLYGMQGTLLSGEVGAIRAYYDQMVEECQLINNENVIALKHIPSPAVGALLLNKLQEANKQHIPFYITVGAQVHWSGLRDNDLTQLLGILVDNALEAAAESAAPHVALEISGQNGVFSLIVRNSYHGDPPVINPTCAVSTKAGHDGLGLHSINRILRRYRNVLFNIYTIGRYVEASLLCYSDT